MKYVIIIILGLVLAGGGLYFIFFAGEGTAPVVGDTTDGSVASPTDVVNEPAEPEPDMYPGDADRDGIPDEEERTLGLDATEYDTDRDGLADNLEINGTGTDPKNPDSDGDGLTDGQEFLIFKSDPNNRDSDGDGYDDATEVQNGYSPVGDGVL